MGRTGSTEREQVNPSELSGVDLNSYPRGNSTESAKTALVEQGVWVLQRGRPSRNRVSAQRQRNGQQVRAKLKCGSSFRFTPDFRFGEQWFAGWPERRSVKEPLRAKSVQRERGEGEEPFSFEA